MRFLTFNYAFWEIRSTVRRKIESLKNSKHSNSVSPKASNSTRSVPRMEFMWDNPFKNYRSISLKYTLSNKEPLNTVQL